MYSEIRKKYEPDYLADSVKYERTIQLGSK